MWRCVLSLSIPLALAAQASWAFEVPTNQDKPPAGKDYPYRPACRQLQSRPSSVEGWNAWGPVIEGAHQSWYGLESGNGAPLTALDAAGLCVLDGVVVPWGNPSEVHSESVQTPLETRHQQLTDIEAPKSSGDDDGGLLWVGLLLILGGAWHTSRDDSEPDFEPRYTYASPFPQPSAEQALPALQSASAAVSQHPEPFGGSAFSAPPTVTVSAVEAPSSACNQPYDFAALLAHRLKPTLITANPRKGKGMIVAHAGRIAKQKSNVSVWLVQPKYVEKEKEYWSFANQVFGFMAEDYAGATAKAKTDLTNKISEFIGQWRKQGVGKTILIFDELSMMQKVFNQWYKTELTAQIAVEMSSGETCGRAFWGVTQSSQCGDIGISGGERSMFDLLVIESDDTQAHLGAIRKSYPDIPEPDSKLYKMSGSPKNTVAYHNALGDWHPMIAYSEFRTPSNTVEQSSMLNSTSSTADRTPELHAGQYSEPKAESGEDPSSIVRFAPPNLVKEVISGLALDRTESEIIKDVLGYKSERYQLGRQVLDEFKSVYGM